MREPKVRLSLRLRLRLLLMDKAGGIHRPSFCLSAARPDQLALSAPRGCHCQ